MKIISLNNVALEDECDSCAREPVIEIIFENKHIQLCENCRDKIITMLNTSG